MTPDGSEFYTGPIRTLVVIDRDVVTRLGGIVSHLCVGMIDESVQVSMLNRSADARPMESMGPGRVVSPPARRWFRHKWSADVVLAGLGGQRPHIVHCMSGALARLAYSWCAAWKTAMAVQLTDSDDLEEFVRLRPGIPLMGLAMSSHVEKEFVERQPRRQEQIRVVPPGLPAESRPAYQPTDGHIPTAVITTPLIRHCGLETVFKAMKSVIQAGTELQLFIIATGKAEGYYRRMVEELALLPWVTFTTGVADWSALRKVMSAADFFIEPNPHKRFNATGLTALAGGLVILAPESSSEDYFIEGQTASLFDPHKPKQLAEKWLDLLRDPQAAGQLAQSALDYAKEHHQASTMVGGTAFLYRQLCV